MAVGLPMKTTYADGDVYSASDVNDITGTVNLIGQTNNFYAGKNKIINGNFGVWQRGTSFSNPATGAFSADRWFLGYDGSGTTRVISQQTFTPGTAPVSGYESAFFLRINQSVAGTNTLNQFQQRIEDVRTFAGQTVTLSFWAKAAANRTITAYIGQNFGSGGSSFVSAGSGSAALTTSWQRFSVSITMPSLTGKTIGTSSYLEILFDIGATTFTIDFWGVQLESGSTATAFQTASGTIQGELALCQRYTQVWPPISGTANATAISTSSYYSSTVAYATLQLPTEMRVAPGATFNAAANYLIYANSTNKAGTAISLDSANTRAVNITVTTSAATAGFAGFFSPTNANGYVILSSEF